MQPLLAILVLRMALGDLTQTIPHQKLIVPRRKQRCGHIDQDRNPAIVHVGERFSTEEDGGHDARAQVSSEVRGDGDIGEAPDHGRVRQPDGQGDHARGDEGIGGVEAGPDDDADVGVDEELGQEEIAEIATCPLALAFLPLETRVGGNAYVWLGFGNVHRRLAGAPFATRGMPFANVSALKAAISGQYMPMSRRPATKAPKTWENI